MASDSEQYVDELFTRLREREISVTFPEWRKNLEPIFATVDQMIQEDKAPIFVSLVTIDNLEYMLQEDDFNIFYQQLEWLYEELKIVYDFMLFDRAVRDEIGPTIESLELFLQTQIDLGRGIKSIGSSNEAVDVLEVTILTLENLLAPEAPMSERKAIFESLLTLEPFEGRPLLEWYAYGSESELNSLIKKLPFGKRYIPEDSMYA